MATRHDESRDQCGCPPYEEDEPEEEDVDDYDLLECLGSIGDSCEDMEDEERRECLADEAVSCLRGLDE